jgi:hypothetical protein
MDAWGLCPVAGIASAGVCSPGPFCFCPHYPDWWDPGLVSAPLDQRSAADAAA